MNFINGLDSVINAVDGFLWAWPLIIILVGTHLYLTVRTRFIQRKVFLGIRLSFAKDDAAEGNISQFGALTTALSATIGTGNIVGVASAIMAGGVGAVFWMWIIGVFGIATKYVETYISVKFRVKDHNGDMLGGAMYALERGFPGKSWAKTVAFLFGLFAALATFGIGAAVQSNSLCGIINVYVPAIPTWVMGIVVAFFVALVILGGVKRISAVCEKVVPFMAIFYVLCCLIIIVINGRYLGSAIHWIITCAFTKQAMIGGGVGFGVMAALRYGAARGLFSNESGMGSAPLAAANATTRNPARQALVSMTGTFWDTVVVCLITALTLVTSILANPDLGAMYAAQGFDTKVALTVACFNQIPIFGPAVLIVGMVLFSYTTMLGWNWYGNRAISYLLGRKAIAPYQWVFLAFILLGTIGGTGLAGTVANMCWNFADIMNGLMVIPNVIACWALIKLVAKETDHYVYGDRVPRPSYLDEISGDEIPVYDNK